MAGRHWTPKECAQIERLIRTSETTREAFRRFCEESDRVIDYRAFHAKAKKILGRLDDVLALDLLQDCSDFATDEQKKLIQSAAKRGIIATAKDLGISIRAFRSQLKAVLVTAARRGYAPNRDVVKQSPPGMHLKGITIQRDGSGEVVQTWSKNYLDKDDKLASLVAALETLKEPYKALAKPAKTPKYGEKDLLTVYPMGDPHIGLLTWKAEVGESHNLAKAERTLFRSIDQLCTVAPPSEKALIVNLGDFFHADDSFNRTPQGQNPLDVDSRYPKIMRVGVNLFRRLIDRALQRHKEVHVICEIGNHDMHMAIMLATILDAYYEKEPRVFIDTSPAPYHWFEFGKNFFGITHGNNVKPHNLPSVMAALKPEEWGRSKYRFWLLGHVHQQQIWDKPGCLIESFRTLAPSDAWHYAKGYVAGRSADAIVHHKEKGRLRRYTIGLGQL